jgi:hypothetical protein
LVENVLDLFVVQAPIPRATQPLAGAAVRA